MNIEFDQKKNSATIKVIGVGGAGCNAVNTMIDAGLEGVEFIVANTDQQVLDTSKAAIKIQLGESITKGLGAGANPEIGKQAALEDIDKIKGVLADSDMVFITAGMGGGTGTGAAPVIAEAIKTIGALTVAVVTKPFDLEGKRRKNIAEEGLKNLKENVDSLIAIPNQRLFSLAEKATTLIEGFKLADEVLLHAIKSISDLINIPGLINLDFADAKTIMSNMGMAFMGIGLCSGENRAAEAARKAISNPLLDNITIRGAKGILINITASSTLSLIDIEKATEFIQREAHEDANIIFGAAIDESLGENLQITVIATGFENTQADKKDYIREVKSDIIVQEIEKEDEQSLQNDPVTPENVIKIGTIISEFTDDGEYDIPTFVRNQRSI
jgi:cell division protein FtsZ